MFASSSSFSSIQVFSNSMCASQTHQIWHEFLLADVRTLRNRSHVEECHNQVRNTLHEYSINCYQSVPVSVRKSGLENCKHAWLDDTIVIWDLQDKFNQMLSLLPDLRDMAQRGEDFLYFKHMQGHAPHHTLLMEMLLAKRTDVVRNY